MLLNTKPNIMDADGFYADLLRTHRGLSEADSHALNARLVLILANELGGHERLVACLAAAVVAK